MQRKYVTSLDLLIKGGGGLIKKIQLLVKYTCVQMCNLKLSRPQNKPDKHN